LNPFIFAGAMDYGGKTIPEEAKVNTIAWLRLANESLQHALYRSDVTTHFGGPLNRCIQARDN